MINGFKYGNYRISVSAKDTFGSTRLTPTVDISPPHGTPVLYLGTSQVFATESEAESCGVEMGKEWIDKQ